MQNQTIGAIWFLLSILCNITNDILIKLIGPQLHSREILFLRFTFSSLFLLPFIICKKSSITRVRLDFLYVLKGIILFLAFTLWTYGIPHTSLATATLINLLNPIFILLISPLFFKNHLTRMHFIAITIGFIAIIILVPTNNINLALYILLLVMSVMLFALLDIINKKYIYYHSTIHTIFYPSCIIAILALIPTYYSWKTPSQHEIILCAILGMSGNLLLFSLLRTFCLTNIKMIISFRYIELIISSLTGIIIFQEPVTINSVVSIITTIISISILLHMK